MTFYKKDTNDEWVEVKKEDLLTGEQFKEVKPTRYGDLIIEGVYSAPPADETTA